MNSGATNAQDKHGRIELVYCPMCTHVVEGWVITKGRKLIVEPGQECKRCHSALDAGYVIRRDRAA
jgi:NAD-dependent SIR2 family protein deacetylase